MRLKLVFLLVSVLLLMTGCVKASEAGIKACKEKGGIYTRMKEVTYVKGPLEGSAVHYVCVKAVE